MRRNASREGLAEFQKAQRGPPGPATTLGTLQRKTPGKWVWLLRVVSLLLPFCAGLRHSLGRTESAFMQDEQASIGCASRSVHLSRHRLKPK